MHDGCCPKSSDKLALDAKDAIVFPEGLVGQPTWRRFVLVDDNADCPIRLLQSLDDPDACFLVTDPRLIFSGYDVRYSETDVEALEIDDRSAPVILCTLRVWPEGQKVTANLLGPLVMNPKTRIAKQLVLVESPYSTQHPVSADKFLDRDTGRFLGDGLAMDKIRIEP
jgi:flagellar assembly factor FliW